MKQRSGRYAAPLAAAGLAFAFVLPLAFSALAAGASRPHPSPAPLCGHPALPPGAVDDGDYPEPPRGSRGYDVQRYDLDLRIDPADRSVAGSVRVTLQAVDGPLSEVLLDLVPGLDCNGVTRSGAPLSSTRSGDSLVVALEAPLPAGETTAIDVAWSGRPTSHGELRAGLFFRSHDAGTREDRTDDQPAIFSVSEPWSAHSWWPCKDNPADKALLGLSITVPDTLSAVGNGRLVAASVPEPGWRTTRWEETYPIATYLVAVAASNYVSWTGDCLPAGGDRVPLEFHFYPQDETDARYETAPTCRMIEFMTDLAGPYPFAGEKYAQVGIKWLGAMENQTMTGIPQYVLRGDGHFETMILHELAHHWFGDSLGPAAWNEIWLNEGFARYCEALWVEQMYGSDAYADFLWELGPDRHETLFEGEGILSDPNPIIDLLVYDKGALVLHMLRGLIGDDAFFGFLHEYATAPERVFGTVTTPDMIAVAERWAGRSLDGFFAPWLTTDQVPRLSAQWERIDTGSSLGRVTVSLRQEQELRFELPVPVGIYFRGGMREETVRLTGRSGSWEFTVPGAVDSVVIDPRGAALLRADTSPPPQLRVSGPVPNPIGNAKGQFTIFLTRSMEVEVKAYDVRGRLVGRRSLGTLPVTGPAELAVAPCEVTWPFEGAGAEPASGVYWLEFRGAGLRVVKKAVLVR